MNYFIINILKINIDAHMQALLKYTASIPPAANIKPINIGPMVCPTLKTIPFTDINVARFSSGARLAKMLCILGRLIPCANPNNTAGIRKNPIFGRNGIRSKADACARKEVRKSTFSENNPVRIFILDDVIAVTNDVHEKISPIKNGEALNELPI